MPHERECLRASPSISVTTRCRVWKRRRSWVSGEEADGEGGGGGLPWRSAARAGALSTLLLVGGCAAYLPAEGPPGGRIRDQAGKPGAPSYVLVKVDEAVVAAQGMPDAGPLDRLFRAPQTITDLRAQVGDRVQVTIFEEMHGGLFAPVETGKRAGNMVELPLQTVARDGTIQVPFAGAVVAAGRPLAALQADIERKLSARGALGPQVLVTVEEQHISTASVIGEVRDPQQFALSPAGDRILDAIARAGGAKHPSYDTLVVLTRKSGHATVSLDRLLRDPAANIILQPGDMIYVDHRPRTFMVFGATGLDGDIPFDTATLSVAEALGKADGLLDTRADPAAVFLFRSALPHPPEQTAATPAPTVYSFNLRDPTGYFLASRFRMEDKDVLFVSNHPTSAVTKLLQLLGLATAQTRSAITIQNSE